MYDSGRKAYTRSNVTNIVPKRKAMMTSPTIASSDMFSAVSILSRSLHASEQAKQSKATGCVSI